MNYVLIKEKINLKVLDFENNQNAYLIKFKKQEISLNYQKYIDTILLKEVFKILNPILIKVLTYLTSEEDEETETGKLYDELAKQRSIILKKYEKHLSREARDKYFKNIRFLALELQKRLKTYTYKTEKTKTR
ncbi:MAG: hypothetical protein PHG03_00770 [Bacilli bacterium]|nr:hypothetical protein [Bacilli bacterium]MDD4795078.1 hypothetical protein [Bacilli bacterium]